MKFKDILCKLKGYYVDVIVRDKSGFFVCNCLPHYSDLQNYLEYGVIEYYFYIGSVEVYLDFEHYG